jgi:hypothetical protein
MNASDGASMLETLAIVLCIAGTLFGGLLMAYRYGQKHVKGLASLACAQGWTFSGTDTLGLAAKTNEMIPSISFDVRYVMTVETGPRRLYLVDGAYKFRQGTMTPQFASLCLLESGALRAVGARIQINTRNWIDQTLLTDQVDMGDTLFAKDFIVQSKDEAHAQRLMKPPIQQLFLDHQAKPLYNPVQTTLNTGCAVFLAGSIEQPERWLDLLEFARQIESCVERQGD